MPESGSVRDAVAAAVEQAYDAPIEGWDFSWLERRSHETQPPWRFVDLVRTIIATSELTLDIDTGGGEFLERVAPARGTVLATEGHPPNVQVAARRLAPLGITCRRGRTRRWSSGTAGVVHYLRLVPWAVEAFDPDADGQALAQVQRRIEEHGELRVCGSHMLIDCVKH